MPRLIGLLGCETGADIAGVDSATALREADGRGAVTVTMTCELVYGMPRGDGHCHADDETGCVVAERYDASDMNFSRVSPL